MASPTESEVKTMFRNVVKLYDEALKFAGVTPTNNWVDLEDVLVQSLETDFGVELLEAVAASRGRLDALLRDAAAAFSPIVRQWGKTNNFPETATIAILSRLYRHFIDVSGDRVQSRQFTFGTPTAATGNVGDGVILRLNKDADNFDIENQHADAKVAKCVSDMNTGAPRHEEVFEFRGQTAGRDSLRLAGSGAVALINAYSARDSILRNPSFSRYSGDALDNLTEITDWVPLGDLSNYAITEDYYYRDFEGDTTPRSLRIRGNDTLMQRLSTGNTKLQQDVPYLMALAYNRNYTTATACSSGASLTVHVGSISVTFDLASGSGWQRGFIPGPTPTANCWVRNFNEDDLAVKLVTSGLGPGEEVLVDDILWVPGVPFDGSWYWVLGGATRFLLDDVFEWADSEVGAVIQTWLWRAFGVYLPHATDGSVTLTDP